MYVIKDFFEIGIVTYNRLEFVSECISSIVNHTKAPFRIYVVDNASTDGTREYIEILNRKGLVHKFVLNNKNTGIAESKNRIVEMLEWKSDFFVLTDSDIVFPYMIPDWITVMLDTMNRHPALGVLGMNFLDINVPEDTRWWFQKQLEPHRQKKHDLIVLESGFWGSLVPKNIIEGVSRFNRTKYGDSKPFRCRSLYGETDEMFRDTLSKMGRWCGVARNVVGINLGWDDSSRFGNYHIFKKKQRSVAEKLRKEGESG
jgi:glycosyltransferase involved in cell wall biosynthesis